MKEQGITFHLPFLLQADISAEPIHPTSPTKVHEMWGVPMRSITHSYGFAEATIWVSTSDTSFDPDNNIAVCGDLGLSKSLNMHIVIADKETGKLVPGVTGDIFVKGRGIAKGYWNNPEASKAFHHTLEGLEGEWFLSGDLGYIKNNKLYCNGRTKDVIIVNGKNFYASDLELRLEESFPTVIRPGCSAAFQVGDDEAVIICELKPGQESAMTSDLLIGAKRDLEQEFGLQIKDIVCTLKGTVPKTTSGKIRRSETKKQYLAGNITSNLGLSETVLCDTFDQLLKHYDVVDMNKTLIESGIDSLKLTRLMEDAKLQFDLHIDFIMAQEIPCAELEVVAKQKTTATRLKPVIPAHPIQGKRMSWFLLAQIVLVLLLIAFISLCVLPSAYMYQYLTSVQFLTKNPELIEPWVMTFSRGPGFLLIAVPILWMMSYSMVVIVLKWIIIGRYRPGRYALWSHQFAAWWFVDRLVEIWELLIGTYFLDTPFLNLFYKAMGMNCYMNTRFHCFVREFDLITCGSNSRIKGLVLARLVDQDGLLLDNVSIDSDLKLASNKQHIQERPFPKIY